MKKLSSMFAVLAFAFAIGVSFAGPLLATVGYYDINGTEDGGGGSTMENVSDCSEDGSSVCTITISSSVYSLHESQADAANGGPLGGTSSPGVLKRF